MAGRKKRLVITTSFGIILVIASILCISHIVAAVSCNPHDPGDPNGDGKVNAGDITQTELCILNPVAYPPSSFIGWDANEDSSGPNAGDLLAIEYRILEAWPLNHVRIYAPDELPYCTNFDVYVQITHVDDFDSASYDIVYNTSVLELVPPGVTAGQVNFVTIPASYSMPGGPGMVRVVNNVPGVPGVSGSGWLCKLRFHVIGSGCDASDITFNESQCSLWDNGSPNASEISATWEGDSIHIAAGPTPSPTPSPTPTRLCPETYMNPIPARVNDLYVVAFPWIYGTTLQRASGSGYDIVDVEVQVQRSSDGWCWNDSSASWVEEDIWTSSNGAYGVLLQELWTTDQWYWDHICSWGSADFTAGWSYTVRARAVDFDGYKDLTPATDTFIYDDEAPDVSFTTNLPATVYNLTQINGTAQDDCGDIAGVIEQVRMLIYDSDNAVYWNGHYWQAAPVWIKCQGTNSWSISTSTDPRLPDWQNNVNYELWVQASDNADNRDFDPGGLPGAGYAFLYRHDISSTAGCYLNPLPAAASAMTNVYGTSDALPLQNIVNVYVEVKDTTDNVFWSVLAGDWAGSLVDWVTDCIPATITYDPTYAQWDWDGDLATAGVTFTHGHTYQVRAQAVDDSATPKTYISGSDSFLYDIIIPAQSNIDAFDSLVYNSWNSLTGDSEDDAKGKIAATIVHIQRTSDGLYWNGLHWGAACWGCADPGGDWDWTFATASSGSFPSNHVDWEVKSSTTPSLPPPVNDEQYTVTVFTFDQAGNMEATATKIFEFRIDLSGYTPPIPTPTSTTAPTTPPSTPIATATPTATAPP